MAPTISLALSKSCISSLGILTLKQIVLIRHQEMAGVNLKRLLNYLLHYGSCIDRNTVKINENSSSRHAVGGAREH